MGTDIPPFDGLPSTSLCARLPPSLVNISSLAVVRLQQSAMLKLGAQQFKELQIIKFALRNNIEDLAT